MQTKIICNEDVKKEIVEKIREELVEAISLIDCIEDEIEVEDIEGGVNVEYPVGDIFGMAWDYVERINDFFCELKSLYPEIGVSGIAYEYDTMCYSTGGFYFHCEPTDKSVESTQAWQICESCGQIISSDTFYNSSQWDSDSEEGNRKCICSKLCMVKYVLSESNKVETNSTWDEKEVDKIWDSDDPQEETKKLLVEKVLNNLNDYIEIINGNKESFPKKIKGRGKLVNIQKELLEKIQSI